MTITINGEPRDLPAGTTIAEIVESLSAAPTGIAVAVNGEVVPRGAWASTAINDADSIEVLTAVQGG